ncbi:hypothetical protein B484DRAFT_460817 [Ochromonadaceae sp. CCMP2298]|nr:hypothetical protein B484DRAFT_460817 [Ochromonadaceae sp. CCMP2298]
MKLEREMQQQQLDEAHQVQLQQERQIVQQRLLIDQQQAQEQHTRQAQAQQTAQQAQVRSQRPALRITVAPPLEVTSAAVSGPQFTLEDIAGAAGSGAGAFGFADWQQEGHLTDLDLAHNMLTSVRGLPPTLRRLDLSHNLLTDISPLLTLTALQELDLSFNRIRTFHGLPARLLRVDLQQNLVCSASTLRTLALSPLIQALDLRGNPVLAPTLLIHQSNPEADSPIPSSTLRLLTHLLSHLTQFNGEPLRRTTRVSVPSFVAEAVPGTGAGAWARAGAGVLWRN